jgi:hypothetical protein
MNSCTLDTDEVLTFYGHYLCDVEGLDIDQMISCTLDIDKVLTFCGHYQCDFEELFFDKMT